MEEFQRKVIYKHAPAKKWLTTQGGNRETGGGKGHTGGPKPRGKSAPPLGEASEENAIIVVFGPTGSGKTKYKTHFKERGWREIKTHTTRPPRSPEDDEYVFYTGEDGEQKWVERYNNGDFINVNPNYQGYAYATE